MSQLALLPDPAGTGETQWIGESMQLVNWGGFHGHTVIDLDPAVGCVRHREIDHP